MGNCFGTRRNGIGHYRYVQPHVPERVNRHYRITSKKFTHPLPPPPQHISTYAQKLPCPNPSPSPSRPRENEITFSPHLKSFTLSELINATRYFCPDYLLGEGGFGFVYKGWLNKETLTPAESGSGMAVAIKKLKPEGFQGHKEWLKLLILVDFIIKILSTLGNNRLLVYEFVARGSLENHLFRRGEEPLSWALRLKVAVEAAKGLAFLHASETKVIYRDFKSSNILLDTDFNAKLSDFGLAKAGPLGDRTHVTTQVMGTQGYTAPEYIATGRLTTKCDVYSFGIVLLEIITGRRAIDYKRIADEKRLLEWVRPQLRDAKKLFRIMDLRLEGKYSRKAAYVVANLALKCCHPEAKYRPHMYEVLSILEKIPSPREDRRHKSKTNVHNPNGQYSHGEYDQHHRSPVHWSPQGSPLMPHGA